MFTSGSRITEETDKATEQNTAQNSSDNLPSYGTLPLLRPYTGGAEFCDGYVCVSVCAE